MPQFRVSWEIDIEAGTPEIAARQALAIQRDTESTATAFKVRMVGPCPSCHNTMVHHETCRLKKKLEPLVPQSMRRYLDYTFNVDLQKDQSR